MRPALVTNVASGAGVAETPQRLVDGTSQAPLVGVGHTAVVGIRAPVPEYPRQSVWSSAGSLTDRTRPFVK